MRSFCNPRTTFAAWSASSLRKITCKPALQVKTDDYKILIEQAVKYKNDGGSEVYYQGARYATTKLLSYSSQQSLITCPTCCRSQTMLDGSSSNMCDTFSNNVPNCFRHSLEECLAPVLLLQARPAESTFHM